jgi:hypothetical protein
MFRGLWWAQDGAPAHHLVKVRDWLNAVFGNNRVIGQVMMLNGQLGHQT